MASITGMDDTATMFGERRRKLRERISKAHDRVHAGFDRCDTLADDYEATAVKIEEEARTMEVELKSLTNFSDNAAGAKIVTDPNAKSGGM